MSDDEDRIETMRTFFTAHGHEIDPVMFAQRQLQVVKRAVREQFADLGIVPTSQAKLLEAALGDPNTPVDAPLPAVVNRGRWIACCECGGAEVVDPQTRLFMCGSCFNAAHAHQWRLVTMPDDDAQQVLEAALLMRPQLRTRNWTPDETVTDLIVQNVAHGLMLPGDEIRFEDGVLSVVSAPAPELVAEPQPIVETEEVRDALG